MAKRRRSQRGGSPPVATTAHRTGPNGVLAGTRVQPESLEDEIRLRAYYRYLERETEPERDTEPGDEVTDWLEAEAAVLGRHATGVDADERVSDSS